MFQIVGLIAVVILVVFFGTQYKRKNKTDDIDVEVPVNAADLLEKNVPFYKKLTEDQRKSFLDRVQLFLANTKVTGVGVAVTNLDNLLVASSAIIPLFNFPDWQYQNIDEVLLYPTTFNKEYEVDGKERNILGMVGEGALNRQMVLSLPALRAGFAKNDAHNTGIHEFVHLVDKADGAVDGIPEYLLGEAYIEPWLREMHKQMAIMRNKKTDIDEYALTNEAEFFAVVSEYFFEKPNELQRHHPELFELLERIFSGVDK